MIIIAILVPWISFFLRGKIITGLICLFLQITLIGWIPASIWAVYSLSNAKNKKRMNILEKKLMAHIKK